MGEYTEGANGADWAPAAAETPNAPERAPGAPVASEAPVRYLTRDAILAAPDLVVEEVEMPEWGGTVHVRMLNGRERDAFEESCMRERKDGKRVFDGRNVRAKLIALTLVDDAGGRLFSEEDIPILGRKSAKALGRLFDLAAAMNGLSDEDVKTLSGNSSGQGDDSSSSSLWPAEEPTSTGSPLS